MQAVIDRFEGDQAVLLLGGGQERLVASRSVLPPDAQEGHWLQIEIENGTIVSAAIDEQETAQARQRMAEKLARLRRGEHLNEDPTG